MNQHQNPLYAPPELKEFNSHVKEGYVGDHCMYCKSGNYGAHFHHHECNLKSSVCEGACCTFSVYSMSYI